MSLYVIPYFTINSMATRLQDRTVPYSALLQPVRITFFDNSKSHLKRCGHIHCVKVAECDTVAAKDCQASFIQKMRAEERNQNVLYCLGLYEEICKRAAIPDFFDANSGITPKQIRASLPSDALVFDFDRTLTQTEGFLAASLKKDAQSAFQEMRARMRSFALKLGLEWKADAFTADALLTLKIGGFRRLNNLRKELQRASAQSTIFVLTANRGIGLVKFFAEMLLPGLSSRCYTTREYPGLTKIEIIQLEIEPRTFGHQSSALRTRLMDQSVGSVDSFWQRVLEKADIDTNVQLRLHFASGTARGTTTSVKIYRYPSTGTFFAQETDNEKLDQLASHYINQSKYTGRLSAAFDDDQTATYDVYFQ